MATSVVRQSVERPPQFKVPTPVSFDEILSAVSFALDGTEDAMPGHAHRTCLLAMRLAQEVGLPPEQMLSLYYASLLKDVGCGHSPAHLSGMPAGSQVRGSQVKGEPGERLTDAAPSRGAALPLLCRSFDPSPANLRLAGRQNWRESVSTGPFARSAEILRNFDLHGNVARAVRGLNERWDGAGYPDRLAGDDIPLLARILAVAQCLDLIATRGEPVEAIRAVRDRRGHSLDPRLVWIAEWLHRKGLLWTGALPRTPARETRRIVLDLVPRDTGSLETSDIDHICEAFAAVVDANSSYTYRHSQSVSRVAEAIAQEMRLDSERVRLVRRAALLHDIGKLRVPGAILNKPGSLQPSEWAVLQEHPRFTREILSRIKCFEELAMIAGAHHERLDGSGYPDRLKAEDLPMEARIIAVADVYDALTADRPYHLAMTRESAVDLIRRESPQRLDPQCCSVLSAVVSRRAASMVN